MPREDLNLLKSVFSETGDEFELTIQPPETIELIESLFNNTDLVTLFERLERDRVLRQLLLTHKDVLSKNLFSVEDTEDEEETEIFDRAMTNILRKMLMPFLFYVERGKEDSEPNFSNLREQSEKKLEFKVPMRWISNALEKYGKQLQERIGDKTQLIEADDEKTDEEKGMELISLIISNTFKPLNDDKNIIKTAHKAIQRHVTDYLPDVYNFIFEEGKSALFSVVEKNSQFLFKSLPISKKEYHDALEVLCFKTKSIAPFLTLQWCGSPAHSDLPYSLFLLGHSRVPKAKCPICNKSLSHATVYTFRASIASLLRQQDGMLPYFIMWLLEERNYIWSPNTYLKGEKNDSEKDIIFMQKDETGYSLIECKTFIDDRENEDVTIRRIRNKGLNSLLKYVKSYAAKEIPVSRLFLFTNLEITSEIQERIKKMIANRKQYKLLRGRELYLLGSTDFEQFYKILANDPQKRTIIEKDEIEEENRET